MVGSPPLNRYCFVLRMGEARVDYRCILEIPSSPNRVERRGDGIRRRTTRVAASDPSGRGGRTWSEARRVNGQAMPSSGSGSRYWAVINRRRWRETRLAALNRDGWRCGQLWSGRAAAGPPPTGFGTRGRTLRPGQSKPLGVVTATYGNTGEYLPSPTPAMRHWSVSYCL